MGELIWFMLTSHQKRDSFTGVYHNESGEGKRQCFESEIPNLCVQ